MRVRPVVPVAPCPATKTTGSTRWRCTRLVHEVAADVGMTAKTHRRLFGTEIPDRHAFVPVTPVVESEEK